MGALAFDTVVAEHQQEIYRYLRRATARASEAEDLTQEAFLRAYAAYRSLPPDANVRAWLFAIATNLFRNHYRAAKRRRAAYSAFAADDADGLDEGPETAARFQEARSALETAVERLPAKQRLAFILRKVHELPYDAIARSLDCSEESARAHVFQAFRKIRQAVNGHELPRAEATP